MKNNRELLKDKKRIVVKIGSSSLTHAETGNLNLTKMEKLVRVLTDIRNQGKEIVLVSSGAIAVGRKTIGIQEKPKETSLKQAAIKILDLWIDKDTACVMGSAQVLDTPNGLILKSLLESGMPFCVFFL